MRGALIDLLDENGNRTGKAATRDEVHQDSLWHGAAHLWIYSPSGKVLMQKRSMHVEAEPGKWDASAAGHIDAGETPEIAAIRELKEELGITIDQQDLGNAKILKVIAPYKKFDSEHREFWYIFFVELGEDTPLQIDQDEVSEFAWFSYEEFLAAIKDAAFAAKPEFCKLIKAELSKRIKS